MKLVREHLVQVVLNVIGTNHDTLFVQVDGKPHPLPRRAAILNDPADVTITKLASEVDYTYLDRCFDAPLVYAWVPVNFATERQLERFVQPAEPRPELLS